MKKIAFFAHGPGSANALLPVIQNFSATGNWEVVLFAVHPFVASLWNTEERNPQDYPTLFQQDVDLIVYGTASGHQMERLVPFYANQQGIPTVSVLDIYWATAENLHMRYEHPPTHLIVPSEGMKNLVVSQGIMRTPFVWTFGNPHFDRLAQFKGLHRLGKPPYDIVIFTQPDSSEGSSETSASCKQMIMDLLEIKNETSYINSLTLSPHPREDINRLKTFCFGKDVAINEDSPSFALLLDRDLNIGVNCTLQYESEMLGIPTIFHSSMEDTLEKIQSLPRPSNKQPTYNEFDATDKVANFLYDLLGE